jgi:hypothetical protein
MKKTDEDGPMRPEYDFSKGVRGKYAERFAQATNLRVLDEDMAAAFPDSASVNEALRKLIRQPPSVPRRNRKATSAR